MLVALIAVIVLIFMATLAFHVHASRKEVLVANPSYRPVPRPFTSSCLAEFDGVRRPEVYVSVKGTVFRVDPQWYGLGAPYHAFAGRDASRQLAKTIVGSEECNASWLDLTGEHRAALDEWFSRFSGKYDAVGWYVPSRDFYQTASLFEP